MSARPLPSTIAHLDALTATGADGYLVVSTYLPERERAPWASWSFPSSDVDAAAQAVAELDQQGRNVYIRASLIGRPLKASEPGWSFERGRSADTSAAVALVVDLDVAGPGHKPGPGLPLPPDRATALGIVAQLPAPSLTIDTGGGLHLWWLLYEPETDEPVPLLEEWGHRIEAAGAAQGWHVDRPDAARVLRVCGTHRRKNGVTPNRVTLADATGWPHDGLLGRRPWCPAGRYGARELLEALPASKPPAPPPAPARERRPGEVGPADAVGRLTWAQILEPLGWTFAGMSTIDGQHVECWDRPGATSSPSLKAFPIGPAIAWSDACGLPPGKGQKLSKWRVFCDLHFPNDDPTDVARTIRRRAQELTHV